MKVKAAGSTLDCTCLAEPVSEPPNRGLVAVDRIELSTYGL